MIPQSETERLMEKQLNCIRRARRAASRALRFVPDHDRSRPRCGMRMGARKTARAWLIGCDGAHSAVRHGLGMQFEGDTLPSDWILADVHLDGVPSPDELGVFWHSRRGRWRFPDLCRAGTGDRRRWRCAGHAHRPDPTMEESGGARPAGPGGITASRPIWLASFRINERKVADYRAGRVFLAGDAAARPQSGGWPGHEHGMQDACNLAWKLALVIRGLAAPEPLLE